MPRVAYFPFFAVVVVPATVAAALISFLGWQKQRRRKKISNQILLGDTVDNTKVIRPPLPWIIQKLLSDCRLAYLATVDIDCEGTNASSHLSLMRFTYIKEEEVIILSTRKQTKKFDILKKLHNVALLVHDFGSDQQSSLGYSITLNGECTIVESGEEMERYRAAHLNHNPDYPQFIVGEDIAILCIHVTSARVCNIHDQVEHWNVHDPKEIRLSK
jgi:general stress protein 26